MKQTQHTKPARLPRIKKGDEVVVISGSQRGMNGRVLAVYPAKNRVLVEGVNVVKRSYKKGTNPNFPDGGIYEKEMPLNISNVMLRDPKTGAPTRVRIETETMKDGKVRRTRVAKASGTAFKD
ncbi:MAG TPA: 50S ribosomal protein L24 [Candidatus Kapabacteria bacterium]|nr:50S ribosomal protein L24 [Candidatus Kapabacteria bacterium]